MKENGLFCVHGFMEDGRTSYSDFATFLNRKGITDYYLTDLQGHGKNESINSFNYRKCIEQVEKEYEKFMGRYKNVFLIGFSMGGVIASHLASKYNAKKLVLISPSFKYGQSSLVVKDVLRMINDDDFPKLGELIKQDSKTRRNSIQQFIKNEYQDKGSTYVNFIDRLSNVTIYPLINFTRLVAKLKKGIILDNISVRIFHSELDELIPLQSSLYIFKKINCADKRLNIVSGVGHRILSSNIKEEVIGEIFQFLYGHIEKEAQLLVA